MITVADISAYIDTLAPPYMAESWDNAGLLCGRKNQEVHKILVALDPFSDVIAEAVSEKADLIVTHHPLIFGDGLTAVNDSTEVGRCLLTLAEHGIAAVNAHTNLDVAYGGINDVLAEILGLSDVEILNPEGTDEQDRPYGLLRCGTVKTRPLSDFLTDVKKNLGCPVLRYTDGGKPVCKVAVGGGACADGMKEAVSYTHMTLPTKA